MTDQDRLSELLNSAQRCISIVTFEEDYVLSVLRAAALELRRPLLVWSVSGGMQEGPTAGNPPLPNTDDPVAVLTLLADRADSPVCVMLDLVPQLRDGRVLRTLRNLLHRVGEAGTQLVLIDYSDELPDVITSHSARLDISLPGEQELEQIIRATLRRVHLIRPIEVDITRKTLQVIVRNLRGLTRRQAEEAIFAAVADDRRFDAEDLNVILARKRQMLHRSSLLEYIETPVDLGQIGGLQRLKTWLAARRNAFTPEAERFGITAPRGVLMLGVQGAGKSLCAKAIATAWHQPLLRMDVGALYDRYVGESERRLRESLAQAESMAPVILWIDEIEKAFASAASRSTDGGLSQRMFGMLLTWMQEHRASVFLVATANDVAALPPELLRKGRFDEIFFVDLPVADARREIFAIHLRRRKRSPEQFDLDKLAAVAEGYSGAEIEQAVVSALHDAYAARRELDTALLLCALRGSPPLSVVMAERVADLRQWAQARCVPAD